MNKKVRHLEILRELFQVSSSEIADSAKITAEFMSKTGYPTITRSRLEKLEQLLREMAQRCELLADEVKTIER